MKLYELRKNLNLSQEELASKLGIGQTSISGYELGKNEPDISTLIKIADFFKVSLDTLVERNYLNVDFSKFTESHCAVLNRIASMTDVQCEKLLSYIDGMSQK